MRTALRVSKWRIALLPMTDDGASRASQAPIKRKFEEPTSPIDCKKLKDCDPSHPAAPRNDGSDSFLETEAHAFIPRTETVGEIEASAEVKDREIAQESAEEEEEEEDEEDDDDDGEVSSDVNSDENLEEDSDATSDDETVRNPSVNPGSSSKGKEKEDIKGKGKDILVDGGKGKAKAEDSDEDLNDENDAGYLSEDPFEEVDLNNILPTRTRRRSGQPVHYDFAEFGDDDDEEDDSDA